MNFEDILNMESKTNEVFLGYKDNTIDKYNIKDNCTIIITGSTGTSKSIMLHQILLQLINKHHPDTLKIVTINPTRVELKQYRESKFSYNKDIQMISTDLGDISNILDKRIELFKENNVDNFDEYNNLDYKSLPLIVVAIDEATDLFKEDNSDERLRWIINNCKRCGIILILTTNNIYNNFFTKGYNTLANIRISFDFVSSEDSKITNLIDCDKLKLNEFVMELNNDYPEKKYNTFTFDYSIIDKILEKRN